MAPPSASPGTGEVLGRNGTLPVSITKIIDISATSALLKIRYRVENLSAEGLVARFGVEFNINLLAGHAHDRVHSIAGVKNETGDGMMDSIAATPDVSRFGVHDGWLA